MCCFNRELLETWPWPVWDSKDTKVDYSTGRQGKLLFLVVLFFVAFCCCYCWIFYYWSNNDLPLILLELHVVVITCVGCMPSVLW